MLRANRTPSASRIFRFADPVFCEFETHHIRTWVSIRIKGGLPVPGNYDSLALSTRSSSDSSLSFASKGTISVLIPSIAPQIWSRLTYATRRAFCLCCV